MATVQARPPKRLSCVSCRQRKIKCDRVDPCAPCLRASIHCVFPQPAPPRSRTKFKAKSEQIAHRLSRLEGLVNALGGEEAIAARAQGHEDGTGPLIAADASLTVQRPSQLGDSNHAGTVDEDIVNPDGGRYLGSDFWSNLSHEVEGLRTILNDASLEEDDEEEYESDSVTSPPVLEERESTPFTFPFGQGEVITDLAARYPLPAHISQMLQLYFQRFDTIFKVLHRPSVVKKFVPVVERSGRFEPGSSDEAIAFALFYGAITTVTPEECLAMFQEEKESALLRFERCCEVALANARLLTTTDVAVIQAFCIYIMCRRTHYNDRSTWSLISLTVRIAFAMDLNSDGETLQLSPFEVEMRRRLWWALIVIDVQQSEDRGTPQLIYSFSHDVKFPLNINDEDMDPDLGILSGERPEFTIMTFSILTFEVARTFEYVSSAEPKNVSGGRGFRIPTMEEKERKVHEVNSRIHERFVKHCDPNKLLEHKAAMLAQNGILKMWLLLQYPVSSRGKAIMPRSLATKDQILSSAVSLLEIQYQLENMPPVSWVSRNWIQWHPLAVVLAELCVRTSGPLVDRAWAIVDAVYDDWGEKVADTKHGALWRPIKKLMDRARRLHRRGTPGRVFATLPNAPISQQNSSSHNVNLGPALDASYAALHESSIAMALDPSFQQQQPPLLTPRTAFFASAMGEMKPEPAADFNNMMNWEDWDTFLRANPYNTGTESYRSSSLEA